MCIRDRQRKLIAGLFQFAQDAAQLFVLNLQLDLMDLEFVNQLAGLSGKFQRVRAAPRRAGFGFLPKAFCLILLVLHHIAP